MTHSRLTQFLIGTCLLGMTLHLMTGCTTPQDDGPGLEVSLADVRFGPATVFETTLTCRLRIDNEGPEPVRLTGGVHRIVINGVRIGKGMVNQEIEVPRLGSVEQEVTIHLSNLSMATRVRSLIETARITYQLDSRLYVVQGGHSRSPHLIKEGTLDLHQLGSGAQPSPAPR